MEQVSHSRELAPLNIAFCRIFVRKTYCNALSKCTNATKTLGLKAFLCQHFQCIHLLTCINHIFDSKMNELTILFLSIGSFLMNTNL